MKLNHQSVAAIACALISTAAHGHPNRRDVATLPYSFPTTVTRIESSTVSGTIDGGAAQPFYKLVARTIETNTLLEPWPASPTSFPYTLVQTKIVHRTYETTITKVRGEEDPTSTTSFTQVTVPSTWVLFKPEATYAAAGAALPCGECAPNGWEGDERCEALGLDTACQGQCEEKFGYLWCYERYRSDEGSKVMGRACWGKEREYMQLVEPCLATDHRISCTPCQGVDPSWDDITWHFE